jgi:antitoxin VapB
MALTIEHPEAERLARALAEATGESITDAVLIAIKERLDREALRRDLRRIQAQFVRGRDEHAPTADEIIGYDEFGLPT